MDEITIKYWSPHGRQEETKFHCDDIKIDLTMRAANKVDLSNLTKCTKLRVLSLSSNMLEELDLSPLSESQTLAEVHLENNHLTSLNLWPLGNCGSLNRLNLTQNRIQRLDLTPVLAKVIALIDSSVVISADSVLQYFFTNAELARRFLLVRPDRAPWTAPPVLMWVTYEDLAQQFEWSIIRKRIFTVLMQMSEQDWYSVQRGLLIGFGMEELAGFDGNPIRLFDNTDDKMDYITAKRMIFDRTVELLDEQITHNGPTLFLNTEKMKQNRASKLITKIVEAREREMETAIIPKKGNTFLMNNLWLTHYGYRILEALGLGLRHFGVGIEEVKSSLEDIGFSLKTYEVESLEYANFEEPVVTSRSMKKFVYNQIEKAYL